MGLHQIPGEPCLFTNQSGVILFFYVDDIVIAYSPDQRDNVESYVKRLMEMFEIRDLGPIKFFLGVRIIRDWKKGTVSMVQDSYMKKLVKEYGIDITNLKAPVVPIPVDLETFDGEADIADTHQYRKMVGSICYPAVGTRPDIAKAASKLSEFLTNPGPNHMKAAMQCLCYLYATKNLGIQYSAKAACGEYLTAEASIPSNQVFEAQQMPPLLIILTESLVRATHFGYLVV